LLANTLLLTSASLLLALVVALPIGVVAAAKPRSGFDGAATFAGIALCAIPCIWLAILRVVVLSFNFRLWGLPSLPATGITSARGGGGLGDRLAHLVLPAVSLAMVQVGAWSAYIRSSMLEALQQDYVRTARAKGLGNRTILYLHAF